MDLYKITIQHAKEKSRQIWQEYQRNTDGRSFKQWMEDYYNNLSVEVENNKQLLLKYQQLLQNHDMSDEDSFSVDEKYIDKQGEEKTKSVTYSKNKLIKDCIELDDKVNREGVVDVFEKKMASYFLAKYKADSVHPVKKFFISVFETLFFFLKPSFESTLRENMVNDLNTQYGCDQKQLDKALDTALNPNRFKILEKIGPAGYAFYEDKELNNEKSDFVTTKSELDISKIIAKALQHNENKLDNEAVKDEDFIAVSDYSKSMISDDDMDIKETDLNQDFLETENDQELREENIKLQGLLSNIFDKNESINTNNKSKEDLKDLNNSQIIQEEMNINK